MKLLSILILLLCCQSLLNALDTAALKLDIMGMEQAKPPLRIGEQLLFSFKPVEPVRYVGVRFEHENYRILHLYEHNQHDLYFLLYPVPAQLSQLKYRMVIDGVYITDPTQPAVVQDKLGYTFSVLNLQQRDWKKTISPLVREKEVTFLYTTESGRQVYVAGDFNSWDPYLYKLTEIKPGEYALSLVVASGSHYYCFWVDGFRRIDPLNPNLSIDAYRQDVSVFRVP